MHEIARKPPPNRNGRDLTKADFERRLAKHGWAIDEVAGVPEGRLAFRHAGSGLTRQGVYVRRGRRTFLRRRETLAALLQLLAHHRRMLAIEARAATLPFALPLAPALMPAPAGAQP